MNELWIVVGLSVVGLLAGWAIAYMAGNKMANSKIAEAEQRAKGIIKDGHKEASNIRKEKLLEVKEEWHKKKQQFVMADGISNRSRCSSRVRLKRSAGRPCGST